jgi:hypothetical protein
MFPDTRKVRGILTQRRGDTDPTRSGEVEIRTQNHKR